jgi:hypothetical protein
VYLLQIIPRIKLYGKKASQEKITKEIRDLLEVNTARPYPLTIAEIAKVLGVQVNSLQLYQSNIKRKQYFQTSIRPFLFAKNSKIKTSVMF